MRLVEERMKGGAVREERSPLKEAMDWGVLAGVGGGDGRGGRGVRTYFEEGRPAAAGSRCGSRRAGHCFGVGRHGQFQSVVSAQTVNEPNGETR